MNISANFGERIEGYDYPVINEREARASAGIMFLLGMFSLFTVYLQRTLFWAELFSITFVIEFIVRTLLNPGLAPYMLLGKLIVSQQTPEWVEARPKHFAWSLGLLLGIIMTFYIVFDIISLIRLAICWICLFLMFVESAFGICLGCHLYQVFRTKPLNCPGGICDTLPKRGFNPQNWMVLAVFVLVFAGTYVYIKHQRYQSKPQIIIIKDQ
ncbi:MAG: DUF4395 domain-containing protein [Saprospiraceae bacterium]|nr:DUF4395 domain-containing protein [Saprospiraceae bacterium]